MDFPTLVLLIKQPETGLWQAQVVVGGMGYPMTPRISRGPGTQRWGQLGQLQSAEVPQSFPLCVLEGSSSARAKDVALVVTGIHIQKQAEHREAPDV